MCSTMKASSGERLTSMGKPSSDGTFCFTTRLFGRTRRGVGTGRRRLGRSGWFGEAKLTECWLVSTLWGWGLLRVAVLVLSGLSVGVDGSKGSGRVVGAGVVGGSVVGSCEAASVGLVSTGSVGFSAMVSDGSGVTVLTDLGVNVVGSGFSVLVTSRRMVSSRIMTFFSSSVS